MKKLLNEFSELIKIINTKTLIATIILIFLGLFAQFYDLGPQENFYDLLVKCFSNYLFFSTILIAISINIVSISNNYKTSNYILKHKNYKEYLNNLLRKNLLYITFIIVISLILVIIMSLSGTGFKIENISSIYPNLSIYLYAIYHLLRVIIYVYLLSIIIFYIEKRFKTNFVFLIIIFILISYFVPLNYDNMPIYKISMMYPFVINYITASSFSNFSLDIICSIIQVIKLIMIIMLFRYLCINKRKENL